MFEGTADTLKGIVDLVGTDGTKFHWIFAAKYDGKDHPATGTSPFGDSLAITRIDKNTIRIVSKLAGKQTIVQTIVVAPDGKTRTTTAKGRTARDSRSTACPSTRSSISRSGAAKADGNVFGLRGRPAGAPPFLFTEFLLDVNQNVGVVGGLSRHCSRRPIAASPPAVMVAP